MWEAALAEHPIDRALTIAAAFSGQSKRTLAQLAIAWVIRRPEVTAAIVGARKPSQIAETAPAADWILTKNDITEIEKLLAERENKLAK